MAAAGLGPERQFHARADTAIVLNKAPGPIGGDKGGLNAGKVVGLQVPYRNQVHKAHRQHSLLTVKDRLAMLADVARRQQFECHVFSLNQVHALRVSQLPKKIADQTGLANGIVPLQLRRTTIQIP